MSDLYEVNGQTQFPTYWTEGGNSSPFYSGCSFHHAVVSYRWTGRDWETVIVEEPKRLKTL